MPAPVTVSIDVPQARDVVYDHLGRLADHEAFTDHMLVDWRASGPETGVGSKVTVNNKAGGNERVDIEVVAADRPRRIVERNVSAGGKRVATGTYELTETEAGGTRISFTFAWVETPLRDTVLAPVIRRVLAKGNGRAMERLAERLETAG